ncbi:hypothetical protein TCAL_08829, partial [Tigriopus californicus]
QQHLLQWQHWIHSTQWNLFYQFRMFLKRRIASRKLCIREFVCCAWISSPSHCWEREIQLKTMELEKRVADVSTSLQPRYSICIRQESGMCCIQYSECEDANSFTLDQKNDNKGFVDNMCTKDYEEQVRYAEDRPTWPLGRDFVALS